jgi:hypothetical protein
MNAKYNRNARSFYTAAYRMLRQEANWQRGQAISNGRSTFYAFRLAVIIFGYDVTVAAEKSLMAKA